MNLYLFLFKIIVKLNYLLEHEKKRRKFDVYNINYLLVIVQAKNMKWKLKVL